VNGADTNKLGARIVGTEQESVCILERFVMSVVIAVFQRVLHRARCPSRVSVGVEEGASGVRTQSSQSGILEVLAMIYNVTLLSTKGRTQTKSRYMYACTEHNREEAVL